MTSSDPFISVRATILLGELLHLVCKYNNDYKDLYLHTTPDEFLAGWKFDRILSSHGTVQYFGSVYTELMNQVLPLHYKNLDGQSVHIASAKFLTDPAKNLT